jgi:pimeloyl-ACP methyl ester carboxylesterase
MLTVMRRRTIFSALALLAACASPPPPSPPPSLEGYWRGTFERGGAELRVELQFAREGDSLTGRFSSPDLRAVGIPLRDVTQDENTAHFVLAGDATTAVFNGVVSATALSGAYVEAETPGRFTFTRGAPPPACREEPAQFSNGAAALAGSLLLPERTPAAAAVLMLHGSGPEGRDANRFEATLLCRAGFAALIYDKRGVGQSTGDWREASFDDLAADAAAGLDWLAARADIDAAHIGTYGHSQGGTISPLVAVRSTHVSFVIVGAGAASSTADAERYSLRNLVNPNIRGDADRQEAYRYVDRVVAAGVTGRGLDELIADAPRYADRPWYFQLPPADASYWRFQRRIADYDSRHYWAQVRAPVLLIFGAEDQRVAPEQSIHGIRTALPAGTPFEAVIIPGADHSYMLHADGAPWPRLAQQYQDTFLDFVRSQAARR